MRSRLMMLVSGIIAVASVTFAIILAASSAPPSSARSSLARAPLPTKLSSYLGVYANGTPKSYQRVMEFARATGTKPNLVGYYSGWPQLFARSFAETVYRHGAIPLVQMDPTYASVSGIAAGVYDSYLRSFADSVREFSHPVVIGFGHEMNATWYSWGYGHVRASTFVAAWRHIVSLFRARARTTSPGCGPSTRTSTTPGQWSPGGQARATSPGSASTGTTTVRPTPSPPCSARPLPRCGCLPASQYCCPRQPWAPAPIRRQRSGSCSPAMRQYQTLGLVWFDIAQHHGIYHQDWRVEDHPAAETAFRLAASRLTLDASLMSGS